MIGLFDANGAIVARYTYDSWGNLLKITDGSGSDKTNDTTFVGYKNPIRYRGYYYDSETRLYYLQSRYYNPEWGRFINADAIVINSLLGTNVFAYGNNNPVMMVDPSGHQSIPYYLDHVWYDIYGHARMDNPKHPDFVYDRSPYDKELTLQRGGAERGTPRTIRSPEERVSKLYTKEDYVVENFVPNTIYNFCQDPFFDSGVGLVIKQTVVGGVTGALGGAATGLVQGLFFAAPTVGTSISILIFTDTVIGAVGGAVVGAADAIFGFLFD